MKKANKVRLHGVRKPGIKKPSDMTMPQIARAMFGLADKMIPHPQLYSAREAMIQWAKAIEGGCK
jgi:hypothetical protein